MTASKTPNLGLMNPVGSDPFAITDFSSTFQIIDQNPGTLVVPNQASRPTGWGANQNGRMVWQSDLGVAWVWNQPSPTSAGSWSRPYGKGWIGGTINGARVTASNTDINGVTVCSQTLTVAGGRPFLIVYAFLWLVNDNTGQGGLTYFENGNAIDTKWYSGRSYGNSAVPPASNMSYYARSPAGTAGSSPTTITFSINLINNNSLGTGQSAIWNTSLDIFEL